ncbi:uncharacterized protein [Zea mays]|uniref:uncharacterized protein LOC107546755 n=1 Tax=Zea mays TaxID=4577 RepID=UPI000221DA6F|nr:uncharacterized protein LOC107546755 [Zea mays]XP_020397903.1 uncharacterized protein LOC107546755 isoform X1 [Zea mays]|eukprot:NP_001309389.1 uncharacterized protein LOC107546755 [Zea mays]
MSLFRGAPPAAAGGISFLWTPKHMTGLLLPSIGTTDICTLVIGLDDTPGIERGLESPSTWKSPWYIDMRKHFQVRSFPKKTLSIEPVHMIGLRLNFSRYVNLYLLPS